MDSKESLIYLADSNNDTESNPSNLSPARRPINNTESAQSRSANEADSNESPTSDIESSNNNLTQAKEYKLDSIKVVAGKTQREIFYENDNIASVSGENLQKLNIQNGKELDKVFSGVFITNEGGSAYPTITIRGMRNGYYYNPNVRVYIDDVPQDVFFLNQELLDVENVELLKGWGGSVYGANAAAGILDIHSNMATNKTKVFATLNLGTKDRGASGSASGALIQDRLYAKASFKYSQFLGQVKDSTTGKFADTSSAALGRVSLLYDDSKLNVGFDYYIDNGAFHDLFYLSNAEISNRNNITHDFGTNGVPILNRLVQTYALKAGYNFESFSIKNVLSYQDKNSDIYNFGGWYEEANGSLSDELKVKQEWDNDSTSLYGIFFSYDAFQHKFTKDAFRQDDTNRLKNIDFGIFTDHAINLPMNLTLNVGLRYNYNYANINYTSPNAISSNNPGNFSDSKGWHNFGARLGLSYTFLSNHKIYTMLSRSFKKGGFANAIYGDYYKEAYKPEINYSAELGYKGFFWGDKIYINAAYFFSYQQDRQENLWLGIVNNQTIAMFGNLGNVLSHGFEFEGKFNFMQDSFVMLNFAYINASFIDTPLPPTNHVLYLPNFNLNLSADVNVFKNSFLGVYVNTSLEFKSLVYYTDQNPLYYANNPLLPNQTAAPAYSQKPYALWNLGCRVTFKDNLSLAFNFENVLNTLYSTYGYYSGTTPYHQIGRLFNFNSTLSYRF
nr:TonB-dependent receptor [Helicobacter saguini]